MLRKPFDTNLQRIVFDVGLHPVVVVRILYILELRMPFASVVAFAVEL